MDGGIIIYNIPGNDVNTSVCKQLLSGTNIAEWDGTNYLNVVFS
jgi:hypothetical protein